MKIPASFGQALLLCVLLLGPGLPVALGDVRLPRLFGDNMILQQKTRNAVWGWAEPGEVVTVKASWGAEASMKTGPDGRWKVLLETPAYGAGHSLRVSGRNTLERKNVAIGEVWLCAGQSNLGWALKNCFGGEAEAAAANLPNYRIFKSQREHWHEPLEESRDRLAQWKLCNPESAAETSAVAYYFGKTLHLELGIPVGIIQQAYAGTPIEGWMPWEIQQHDPRALAHKKQLHEPAGRKGGKQNLTKSQALEIHRKELAAYNAKVDAGESMKEGDRTVPPPFIARPADLGNQYPAHIFNAMIHPVRPYGIRGAIWYQGERNAKDVPQAFHYREQLALLVGYYRSSWHELSGGNVAKDFPFYFTQLPSWFPPQTDPVEGLTAPWAVNREMMRLVAEEVPNTGIAVAIDTGDGVALHPKNKQPIGLRHAYLALERTYGKIAVGSGPRYRQQVVRGDKIILEFDSIGRGLMAAKPGALNSFAIAGADRVWHWADAEIKGNTVELSSKAVPQPVAVRYAWAMNPSQRNLLYNREGFPASPFRTDHWPLFDPKAAIVTVDKPEQENEKSGVDWERPAMKP